LHAFRKKLFYSFTKYALGRASTLVCRIVDSLLKEKLILIWERKDEVT